MAAVPGVTFDFTGARILVTGGSHGIGLATARAFRDAGADVTITGTRAAAGEYEDDLGGLTYRPCDMEDHDALADLAGSFDGLDVLVNNAGGSIPDQWEPVQFERMLDVHTVAPFRLATALRDRLAASGLDGGGSVVNVASMSAFDGIRSVVGYGAGKAAVVQLTKSMAIAWAEDGIRVNAVAPGMVKTNMFRRSEESPRGAALLERIPLQRFAVPEEIAPAVLFVASPAARYMTGSILVVDGGYQAF